jgi:hypothetical protein
MALIVVHATASGPRSAPGISETLIDGTIAAFQRGTATPTVAAALAAKIPSVSPADIEALVEMDAPGPLFATSPFVIKGRYVQISPPRAVAAATYIRNKVPATVILRAGSRFAPTITCLPSGDIWLLSQHHDHGRAHRQSHA